MEYPLYKLIKDENEDAELSPVQRLDPKEIRLRLEEKMRKSVDPFANVSEEYLLQNEENEGGGLPSPRRDNYNVHGGHQYHDTYDYQGILFADEMSSDEEEDEQHLLENEIELQVQQQQQQHGQGQEQKNDHEMIEPLPLSKKRSFQYRKRKKKKITHITFCCCVRAKLQRFFKIQAIMSALSFWSVFGVMLLVPAEDVNEDDALDERPVDSFKFVTFPLTLFLMNSTWFNPAYWSTRRFRLRKCFSKFWFYLYWFVGSVVGLCSLVVFAAYWYCISKQFQRMSNILEGVFLILSAGVACFYYFPMTGYLFYRVPVAFGLSHFLGTAISLIIPLVFVRPEDNRRRVAGETDSVTINRKSMLLASMIAFAVFLAISGFSCTYFRNKKAMIEAQSRIIERKKSKQKEIHMGLIMFFTFSFSLADIVSDVLYAFSPDNIKNLNPTIRVIIWGLFGMQVLVQLVSSSSAVNTLRKILDAPNTYPATKLVRKTLQRYFSFLCCFCYPLFFVFYFGFIILVTVFLTLSKLMAIKQVQNWWLSLMVVNYKLELKEVKKDKIEKKQELEYAIKVHEIQEELKKEQKSLRQLHNNNNNNNEVQDENEIASNIIAKRVEQVRAEMDVDGMYRKERLKAVKGNCLWTLYYRIDDLAPWFIRRVKVNTEVYNTYFLTELICESFPQLLLNLANGWITGDWNQIAYISAFFSGSIIAYNITKIVYYVGYKNKDLKQFLL